MTQNFEALHLAVQAGDADRVEALIRAGVSVDARSTKGQTPLQQAVLAGDVYMCKKLVALGADVKATWSMREKGIKDIGICHLAAQSSVDVLEFVMRIPGVADMTGEVGGLDMDALCYALHLGNKDAVETMILQGASPNARPDRQAPLHFLLENTAGLPRATVLDLLKTLVENGADIEAVSGSMNTPLLVAARNADHHAVSFLLAQGANLRAINRAGDTVLHAAAVNYNVGVTNLLLAAKADPDVRNRYGQTALHIAAHSNKRDVVAALLAAGAEPAILDAKGRTPAMVCQSPMQFHTRALILQAQDAQEATRKKRPYQKKGNGYGGR